jgi:hypothetical protein
MEATPAITSRDINPFLRKITPMYFYRSFINSESLPDKIITILSFQQYYIRYIGNLYSKSMSIMYSN